jgi:hypothetical protein
MSTTKTRLLLVLVSLGVALDAAITGAPHAKADPSHRTARATRGASWD